ncbi:MAG: MazG nucleotide pyrophosphohydrolase domain-containing protein [Bifidobacterium sp.]|nr:MazG nucleotide pyrophosphohydrolase domain-containing protein [Bifidobacterium sp.]
MTDAAHDDYELPEGFRRSPKLDAVRNAPTALERVRAIVHVLHGPGGCPWDGEQTNESLVKPLLEETYEYIDALETGDRENMREELGDMLLQSIFQAEVCAEDAADPFTLEEVCDRLVDKLITRHPHIFADDASDDELTGEETLALWERMKQKEKQRDSVLDGISHAQGALPRASKVASRVRKAKDRPELAEAYALPAPADDGERLADAMLALIREADAEGVDMENALRNRLRQVEQRVAEIESEE